MESIHNICRNKRTRGTPLIFPQEAQQLCEQRTQKAQTFQFDGLQPIQAALELPQGKWSINSDGAVDIQFPSSLSSEQHKILETALKAICPWKKGPFKIDSFNIDAEWQSQLKWNRILPHMHSLEGRHVLDIGCHNGYFMYRMAEHNPKSIVGIEPFAKHWHTFQLLNHLAPLNNARFSLLGVEHTHYFEKTFDTIFCLGILYHHTDPVGLLRQLKASMTTGGQIIIDCQGIPGEDSVALVPEGRYATTKGVWFLPTQTCLINWLRRSGFRNIECFFAEPLSRDEQRTTEWAQINSLDSFLNGDKTVEGYPAPWRFYVSAQR